MIRKKLFKISEGRFYVFILFVLILMFALSVIGMLRKDEGVVFNILLGFLGIFAGYITSAYFENRSKNRDLGKYAIMGSQSTFDIYDTIKEAIEELDVLERSYESKKTVNKKDLLLVLSTIRTRLKVLQRISISANDQWKEFLPSKEFHELSRRERVFEISGDSELIIVEAKRKFNKPNGLR